MSKLSKDILNRIKNDKMKPKSRWHFTVLRTAIWTAVIVTLVLGSLGIAVAIRHLSLTDWELAGQISSNPLNFMPLLWFGIIAVAIFVVNRVFKKTKKGYKFRLNQVVIASLLLSITLGSGFFFVNADQTFENTIRENFKPYQKWENKRAAKFVATRRGVLAGEITDINEDWMVVDFKGKEWKVNISDAKIAPGLEPAIGQKIGMKGKRMSEKEFKAFQIRKFEDAREYIKKRRERLKETRTVIKKEIIETLTDEQRELIRDGVTYEERREIKDSLTEDQKREIRRLTEMTLEELGKREQSLIEEREEREENNELREELVTEERRDIYEYKQDSEERITEEEDR